MTLQRGAGLIGGGALLAAWMAVAGTDPGVRPAVREAPQAIPEDPLVGDLRAQTERLRARLEAAPAPPEPRRNPFRFEDSRSGAAPAPPVIAEGSAPPSGPAPPPLRLIGLAEDAAPEGPLRTAIISGAGEIHFVRPDDRFLTRYRAVAVGPDAVELVDETDGTTIHLRFR